LHVKRRGKPKGGNRFAAKARRTSKDVSSSTASR
jgi:hypothetical protein